MILGLFFNWQRVLLFLFFFSSMCWLREAMLGFVLFEFGDETEKFITAKALLRGRRLYADVYANHGPFLYAYAMMYGRYFSDGHWNGARILHVVLALWGGWAVIVSPVFRTVLKRFYALSFYFSVLAAFWLSRGFHMLVYPSTAALLSAIALTLYGLPVLLDVRVNRWAAVWSGMCLGVLPTLSYAFLPSVLGFTVGFAVLQRNTIAYRWYFAGGMLCVAGVFGCWLFLFGDIQGYFYQHFLYNQPFYTKSYGVSGYDFIKNIFIFDGVSLKNVLVYAERLVACAIWLVLACLPFRMCTWVRILLLVSLLLLNPLGVIGFHHNVLLLVEILLLGFWLIQAENKAWGRFNIAAVMVLVLVVLVLGLRVPSSPHGFKRKAYFTHLASLDDNKNTGLYRFIKKMVPADETILALEYAPAVYLFANRSSSIKSFFYLPHQALYDKAVPDRYRIHLCETILNKKPLLLWYTETPAKMDALIKQYPLVVYEPCFGAILEKYYFRWSRFSPLYMRREYAKRLGLGVGEGLNDHLRAVSVVDIQQPLVFYGEGVQDRIKSIGIRLATFQKKVRASAVLLLYGLDMTVKSLPVDIFLSADQDNDYYWVDLPLDGRGYTRATFQQFHIDEGQLSVWQSGQDTRWKNCIMVEFMDGRQHLTSGCPIL